MQIYCSLQHLASKVPKTRKYHIPQISKFQESATNHQNSQISSPHSPGKNKHSKERSKMLQQILIVLEGLLVNNILAVQHQKTVARFKKNPEKKLQNCGIKAYKSPIWFLFIPTTFFFNRCRLGRQCWLGWCRLGQCRLGQCQLGFFRYCYAISIRNFGYQVQLIR